MFSCRAALAKYPICNELISDFEQCNLENWHLEFHKVCTILRQVRQDRAYRKEAELGALLERYRCELLVRLNYILELKHAEPLEIESAVVVESNLLSSLWNKIRNNQVVLHIGFAIFSIMGLMVEAMDNFLGFHTSLQSMLPALSNPILLGISLTMTALGAVLFISFEMQMLQNLFGVNLYNNHEKDRVELLTTQVKLIKHALQSSQVLTVNHLRNALLVGARDVAAEVKPYHESLPRKLIRWGMTGLGAVTMVTYGYFVGTSIIATLTGLGIVAAGFAVTAPAILLTVGVMLSFFVLFAAMQAKSIDKQLNPLRKPMAMLEKNINSLRNASRRAGDLALYRQLAKQSNESGLAERQPAAARLERLVPLSSKPLFENVRDDAQNVDDKLSDQLSLSLGKV